MMNVIIVLVIAVFGALGYQQMKYLDKYLSRGSASR